LTRLATVRDVMVDLTTGQVAFEPTEHVDDADIRKAVEAAGFEVSP
jgi:hypothetical protein